jgi:hypothetical protein
MTQSLAMPLHVQGRALHVAPSIGIALFPADGETPDALLCNAEAAMIHAKEAGRGNVQFFVPRMNTGAALRFELENDLHDALGRDELFLEYQTRIDLADGSFKGVEALVRWRHPRRGLLAPASFVPLVEETGLIVRLGEWILRRACRQIVEWQEQCGDAIAIAVNMAPRQFQQPQVAERVGAILAAAGVLFQPELPAALSGLLVQPPGGSPEGAADAASRLVRAGRSPAALSARHCTASASSWSPQSSSTSLTRSSTATSRCTSAARPTRLDTSKQRSRARSRAA